MKKIVLTAIIILGFAMASFAQGYYQDRGGGLFQRGFYDEGFYNDEWSSTKNVNIFGLFFPGHNFTTNWNGGSQGHDDELLPLGNGALLLIGFGAAYALSKRNKKD